MALSITKTEMQQEEAYWVEGFHTYYQQHSLELPISIPEFRELLSTFLCHPDEANSKETLYKQWIEEGKEGRREANHLLEAFLSEWLHQEETVNQAVRRFLTLIFSSPGHPEPLVPASFWNRPLGILMKAHQTSFPMILLTSGDAAWLLGVSRQYIHEEWTKGKLPSQKVGKYHVFLLSDLLAYAHQKKNQS
ncbi:helix-turn-helix domain-containing protein [Cytobacillus sp. FJAT-54145]|uniref:Helix-turn-helix domain-containing protein n=1 Tax=Cytobacillus spartinae TaxID=3299023 RepID=A0ABW6KDQ5_9BACI